MTTPDAAPGAGLLPGAPAFLAGCRDAEDYFRELQVDHDPRVLAVGRLHVLRLFGREARSVPPDAGPDAQRAGYRAALERAYAALLDGGPLQHRVFKVLQDRAPVGFVPLAEVTGVAADPPNDPPIDPRNDPRNDPTKAEATLPGVTVEVPGGGVR